MGKKLSYEFVKSQIESVGYTLLSEDYNTEHTKLMILCSRGHEYLGNYNQFQQGSRCPKCAIINNSKKLRLSYQYIKRKIEKENYRLLSTEYKNAQTKLKVKCPKGHICEITYNNFKTGYRCKKCSSIKSSERQRLTYDYIKTIIEKENYKLLSKTYENNRTKLKIQCSKGHEYNAPYKRIRDGHTCPICSVIKVHNKQRTPYDKVKKLIEKENYKLISKEYKNAHSKLIVECPSGHSYEVTYDKFNNGGCRCSKCQGSLGERELLEYINSLGLETIENNRSIIQPLELDIVIPSKKIAIEYCGLYWHNELYKNKNYHLNKLTDCNKIGYRLITIFEDEWVNKNEIVKNRLRYILRLEDQKIYARKCVIKEINFQEAQIFLDKYHIQGKANATIYLGAFHEDELVAVQTFNRRDEDSTFDINRFCISTNVIGIASKFLKHFQRNYKYNKIITFADRRWSEGHLYEQIGMQKDKILRPDYYYVQGQDRVHKFNFRHKYLKNKLENYDSTLSEHENMLNHKIYRIYDCGKIRYILEKEKINGQN